MQHRISITIVLLTVLSSLTATPATAGAINLLVPAYGNPATPNGDAMWSDLIATAGSASFTGDLHVIFNPASGPGNAIEPNYVDTNGNGPLPDLRNAGAIIYGYVPTTFGARAQAEVEADIDKYFDTLYPGLIDGIFFDEMSNDLADVGYYQAIRDYVKTKVTTATVISNPGTSFTNNPSGQTTYTVADYALAADVLVTFEDTADEYLNNYTPPTWRDDLDSSHFAHIVHTQSTWDDSLLDIAANRNAGLVYFTDDSGGNPYDALSSYWDAQSAAISTRNAAPLPSSWLLFGIGLAGLSRVRRHYSAG